MQSQFDKARYIVRILYKLNELTFNLFKRIQSKHHQDDESPSPSHDLSACPRWMWCLRHSQWIRRRHIRQRLRHITALWWYGPALSRIKPLDGLFSGVQADSGEPENILLGSLLSFLIKLCKYYIKSDSLMNPSKLVF